MPDPNDPPAPAAPSPRPIDAWYDAEPLAAPVKPEPPTAPVDLAIDAPSPDEPVVVPVARTRLPEARPANTGLRLNPRPLVVPRGPSRDDRAVETDRPRAQVFLACSVLMAIIAAMIVAVALLGYAIVAGFKVAQDRAKQQRADKGALVQPQAPNGVNDRPANNKRAPRRADGE